MHDDYKIWLVEQGYSDATTNAQMHRLKKLEQYYGPLATLLDNDDFDALISELTYSADQERQNLPNPSKIQFEGNIRNNLQSYKNAAVRFRRFLAEVSGRGEVDSGELMAEQGTSTVSIAPEKQRLALERDMQHSLRRDISTLDKNLEIIDDGAERSVDSGFIDILCKDQVGAIVVVELKAGKSDSRVVAQTLGYMGDLMNEDSETPVRGIIVAHDFDKRTMAAARAVPNLRLYRYDVYFNFDPQD